MSAVRAAIVAMAAGPPPLPAGADLAPPLPRADSVPGQWVNATERPAAGAGMTLYAHGGGFEQRNPKFEQVMAYRLSAATGRAAWVLDGAAPDRAPQSPLHGDLADLPPLLIVAGGDEALLDDARRFAAAASAAGTLVTLDIYLGMVHAFHLSALPEAPPRVAITFLDRLTAWTTALRQLGSEDAELVAFAPGGPGPGGTRRRPAFPRRRLVHGFTSRFRGNAKAIRGGGEPGPFGRNLAADRGAGGQVGCGGSGCAGWSSSIPITRATRLRSASQVRSVAWWRRATATIIQSTSPRGVMPAWRQRR